MKKYYVVYGNFANVYSLFWADNEKMRKQLPEGAEQISRKEAIKMCKEERQRRKEDTNSSGYASAYICPAGTTENEAFMLGKPETDPTGYIILKF